MLNQCDHCANPLGGHTHWGKYKICSWCYDRMTEPKSAVQVWIEKNWVMRNGRVVYVGL